MPFKRTDEEQEIVQLFLAGLAGDEQAHRAFLTRAAVHLRAFFRARLRGDAEAEDLVQETLIALHTKRHTYDPAFPATAWIYAIARYRLIDYLRKVKRHGVSVPIEDAEDALFAAEESSASDARKDVAVLLERLPRKQADAIRLIKLEDLSVADAAGRMGISASDVKVSVHRGLQTLMRLMGEEQSS